MWKTPLINHYTWPEQAADNGQRKKKKNIHMWIMYNIRSQEQQVFKKITFKNILWITAANRYLVISSSTGDRIFKMSK